MSDALEQLMQAIRRLPDSYQAALVALIDGFVTAAGTTSQAAWDAAIAQAAGREAAATKAGSPEEPTSRWERQLAGTEAQLNLLLAQAGQRADETSAMRDLAER